MTPNTLISRLQGVRQFGPDRWSARCPAHDDSSPSLSVRVTDDRILLYCHAGCDVSAILAAIGLSWRDICPEERIPYEQALAQGQRRQRQRLSEVSAQDWARMVLKIAAADIERGRELSLADRATLAQAQEVIRHGR